MPKVDARSLTWCRFFLLFRCGKCYRFVVQGFFSCSCSPLKTARICEKTNCSKNNKNDEQKNQQSILYVLFVRMRKTGSGGGGGGRSRFVEPTLSSGTRRHSKSRISFSTCVLQYVQRRIAFVFRQLICSCCIFSYIQDASHGKLSNSMLTAHKLFTAKHHKQTHTRNSFRRRMRSSSQFSHLFFFVAAAAAAACPRSCSIS